MMFFRKNVCALFLICFALIFSANSVFANTTRGLLEGTYNTRDIGGKIGANGLKVKRGIFIRTDEFPSLTPQDTSLLNEMGVKTIIDFRNYTERNRSLVKTPMTLEKSIYLPIDLDYLIANWKGKSSEVIETMVVEMYENYVLQATPQYKEFFQVISNPNNGPFMYHCTAGKDRTGFATALLLSALGVSYEDIMADYMYSQQNALVKYAPLLGNYPYVLPLTTVQEFYLDASFKVIQEKYGSVDNYLTKELGVDIEKLRSLYLE